MDFSKPPHGLVTPMPPAKPSAPADEPTDDEMLITSPTVGPAKPHRPAAPNPMSVQAPGIDTGTSLAAELNWKIQKATK